ncbi:hypothetical protein Btru_006351 [Bulinus truncatus]|nr:hypothetical protein Btru_006351 [Bulinus truncatus]
MPNLANSRESGAQRNQNESETTIGRTGIIEKRCNSVVEQFKNLRIGAVGGGPSRGCSQNDTSAADSDDDQSVSRHRLDFSSSEYMTKPGKPRHSNSRGGDKGKISLDRQESERESDEDDLLEDRKNFNIQEEIVQSETPVTVVEKPERSTKHGFKYHCKTCDKHMNTRANFDAHIAGASHLYISSLQKVPPRQLDPIRKTNFSFNVHYKDILVHAFNCTIQVPRAYQMELLHKTMMGDYIVYLPTGTGKTLVAVLTMALMLDENPSRPVLFLVDKVLLVLQQTKYIKSQLHEKKINRLNDDKQIVKQEVTIKAICGGVISKTARPIWNYDIVVTTAAFCQNMLERDLIRWEDFSLVVLDEVHHCNKLHPYFKLLDKYHNILPAISRPKILGLTASPAGKSSIQETYDMLQGLLKNLGGAKIAIVEEEDEELKSLQSTAEIHPVCVPLSSKEREFRTALLEYIVLCYSKLAHLSNLRTVTTPPCSYLTDAVNHPGDRQISMRIAKRFLVDEEPLSDLIGVINSANPLRETDSQKFGHLKLHLMQIMLSLSEVGTGADFISELDAALSPSKNVEAFQGLGLPFRDMHELVLNFAADGNKDLTMFSKLIETLKDKTFIDWSNRLSKALILVRERKLARQLTKKLRDDPLITDNNLSVQYLVGHGGGAQSHGMDVKKQKRVLDNQEKYNIFVATSIMEEGIDFQLLEMVISMNPPTSLRALVQIRGRARKKGSHFVILCSSEEEVEKLNKLQQAEKNMQAAAKHCIEKDRLRSISATRSA